MAIGSEATPYDIPQSRGVPPVVRLLFLAGIAVIFVVGAVAIVNAGEFHLPYNEVMSVPLSGHF